jgi:pyrimidine oxygenase
MQLGVFIPIGNNGWLISTTSPKYKPSFDMNAEIVRKAEVYGFDFALSMIKLHGFGGPSEFWNYNLESFTLMAGLAAVTTKIQLFATCAVLTIPPPITARMAVTIDSISHGRFGINIISGWQRREYAQMGIWPGKDHYKSACWAAYRVPASLWAAQMMGIFAVGVGRQRQSSIWKKSPLKSDFPVSHSSFMTVTYSEQ